VVEHISHRIAVMYLGRIVELTDKRSLFTDPQHPYTEALLAAIPKPDPRNRTRPVRLPGEVPSPANPPSGCYFHPRCPYAQEICKKERPELRLVGPEHYAACHFAEELSLKGVPRLAEIPAITAPTGQAAAAAQAQRSTSVPQNAPAPATRS
jgi:peptide/nickel transport system ATP-binding protein